MSLEGDVAQPQPPAGAGWVMVQTPSVLLNNNCSLCLLGWLEFMGSPWPGGMSKHLLRSVQRVQQCQGGAQHPSCALGANETLRGAAHTHPWVFSWWKGVGKCGGDDLQALRAICIHLHYLQEGHNDP